MKMKKPATHSLSSRKDTSTVSILTHLLASNGFVNPLIDFNDKTPNSDGWLIILNNNDVMIGKLETQVKPLKRRKNGSLYYTFTDGGKFFEHCKNTDTPPVILIAVDSSNQECYWKEMTPQYVESLGKAKTVNFDENNVIKKNEIGGYYPLWKKYVEERKAKLEKTNAIRQLFPLESDPKLLRKNEQAIDRILDKLKIKILVYEGLLFLISPSHINDNKSREIIRSYLSLSPQQEELFIDELVNQKILYRKGDLILFKDDNFGREKLRYLVDTKEIKLSEVYDLFRNFKMRKAILNNLIKLGDNKTAHSFFKRLIADVQNKVDTFANNDQIYTELELVEEFVYAVPKQTLKVINKLLKKKKQFGRKEYSGRLGKYKGHSHEDLLVKCLELLEKFRYLLTKEAYSCLFKFSEFDDEKVEKKALSVTEVFAKYNLYALQKIGYKTQYEIIDVIESLSSVQQQKYFKFILASLGQIIDSSFEGTRMTNYRTFSWSYGALKASDNLSKLRKKSIEIIIKLFEVTSDKTQAEKLVTVLFKATQTPVRGDYSEKLEEIIVKNAEAIVSFFVSTFSKFDLEIKKQIEKRMYFLYKRYGEDRIKQLRQLKKKFKNDDSFQIFKVFYGFDYRYGERIDYTKANEERNKLIDKFVSEIKDDNWEIWEKRVILFGKNYDDINAGKYQYFNVFLNKLAQKKPKYALKLIIAEQKIDNFLLHLVAGVWDSDKKEEMKKIIEVWIASGKHLPKLSYLFSYSKSFDIKVFVKLYKAAVKAGNEIAIVNVIRVCFEQFIRDKRLKLVFLGCIRKLTKMKNANWVQAVWFRDELSLIKSLTVKELNLIIENIVFAESIDYHYEEIMQKVAIKHPAKIIDLFYKRVSYYIGKRGAIRYDAIPYSLDKLKDVLSKNKKIVIGEIIKWFGEKDAYYHWEAGNLIQNIFPSFNDDLVAYLVDLIKKGEDKNAKIVLSVLRAYKGQSFLYSVCQEFVKSYLADPKIKNYNSYKEEVYIVLSATGVVSGEHGLSNAYKQKKKEIKVWEKDKNEAIKNFLIGYRRYLNELIMLHKKREDEDIELMKKDYG